MLTVMDCGATGWVMVTVPELAVSLKVTLSKLKKVAGAAPDQAATSGMYSMAYEV